MKNPIVLSVVLALGACVTSPKVTTAYHDSYTRTTSYRSPVYSRSNYFANLVALTEPGERPTYFLMILVSSHKWLFIDSAWDASGERLKLGVLDRKVGGGGVSEKVAVRLNRGYLERRRSVGVRVKLIGDRGSSVVVLDPAAIDEFLSSTQHLT